LCRARGPLASALFPCTTLFRSGGSMGGMQALSLAANWPYIPERVLAIAATATMPAQNIAFQEVGRQAVMADPDWQGGNYYGTGRSEEHTSELQSRENLVCRLLL